MAERMIECAVDGGASRPHHNRHGVGLEVEGVTVTYPNRPCGLRDASFKLAPGTICALVGINGSSKPTLLQGDHGVREAEQRTGIACRRPAEAIKRNLVRPTCRRVKRSTGISRVVDDVVMMGRYGYMGFWPAIGEGHQVAEALERVGMTAYAARMRELSGGRMFAGAGAREPDHPARRAVTGVEHKDGDGHHRTYACAARKWASAAGLDAQSRRAGFL